MPEPIVVSDPIEVAPNADQGHVIDTPVASSEPIDPATPPAEPTEPVVTAAAPELFKLPDGREVTGAELQAEYGKLLPEFTRKSQELARVTGTQPPVTQPNNQPANPLADPEFVPKSFAELQELLAKGVISQLEAKEAEKVAAQTALETEVSNQLAEVQKLDPAVNVSGLFLHATKYGFRNLGMAYQNMKDMGLLVKTVQRQTAHNIAKRVDPVSVQPGAGGGAPDPSQFTSAVGYLRSLKP